MLGKVYLCSYRATQLSQTLYYIGKTSISMISMGCLDDTSKSRLQI